MLLSASELVLLDLISFCRILGMAKFTDLVQMLDKEKLTHFMTKSGLALVHNIGYTTIPTIEN
jgi:hypothetical protein